VSQYGQLGPRTMAKLTKAKLNLETARAARVSLKEAREMLDIILDSMVLALRKGERFKFAGLGRLVLTLEARGKGEILGPGSRSMSPRRGCLASNHRWS
jgi:nucleoid DNA-binding protein